MFKIIFKPNWANKFILIKIFLNLNYKYNFTVQFFKTNINTFIKSL